MQFIGQKDCLHMRLVCYHGRTFDLGGDCWEWRGDEVLAMPGRLRMARGVPFCEVCSCSRDSIAW